MNQGKTDKKHGAWKWLVVGVIVVIAGLVFWSFRSYSTNYAEETAKPIEKALVEAGAVKMCSNGDAGRGVDNREPWHEGYYETSLNRDEAIKLINKIAKDNGYKLVHASKDNRDFRGAPADEFIDNWYFDKSKISPYADLESGKIELAFGVNNDGVHKLSGVSCGKKETVTIESNKSKSMLTVSVRLPVFKH